MHVHELPPSRPLHVVKPSVNPLKRYIKLADTNGAHFSSINQSRIDLIFLFLPLSGYARNTAR